MSGFNFNFSPENFGLGLIAGWGSAYALYRARNLIQETRESITGSARRTREFAARSADAAYLKDILKFIQQDHLAGSAVDLAELVVEPRFLPARPLVAPREEDIVPDVYYVIPQVHDYPYLHAPYNLETLSIEDLDNGDRQLAILGLPGSGRTTALHAIALWSMGEVNFEPPKDQVQLQLEEEERSAAESKAESARRYTERVRVEDLAEEALADKGGVELEGQRTGRRSGLPFRQLTPMYTHLANVQVDAGEFGRNVDPAEPLVRALQSYVGYATRLKIPRNIYKRLEEGKVLLLLDGLDEIPAERQPAILEWLRQFQQTYSNNFIIVTGSPRGYGGLLKAGYTPVFLSPFDDRQTDDLAVFLANNWGALSGERRRRNVVMDDETIQQVKAKARRYSPNELMLRAWCLYHNPAHTDVSQWFDHWLGQRLPNADLESLVPRLSKAAELQIKHGHIQVENLDRALLTLTSDLPETDDDTPAEPVAVDDTAPAPASGGSDLDDALDQLSDYALNDDLDSLAQEISAETTETDPEIDDLLSVLDVDTNVQKYDKSRLSKETSQFLKQMTKAGILHGNRDGTYRFAQPLVASYYASLTLLDKRFDKVLRYSYEPAWRDAMIFAGANLPLDDLVRVRLEDPVDILLTNLLDVAQWLRYVSGKAEWAPALMRRLGTLFAANNQYLVVRERIAAALVSAGTRNALRIFQRSLTHPDPDVRRLAVLAIGALRVEELTVDVAPLLNDELEDVSLAAIMALGSIGTQEALEEIAIVLTGNPSEVLRQASAETFAAVPKEGYPVLFEAVKDEDIMMRRAAIFGLRRIKSPWALISLYETSMDDDQWYVKSAAEQVFLNMQYGDIASGPRRYPRPESIPWVSEWLASLGDAGRVINGDGNLILRKALEEGDEDVQFFAVNNIGQLGLYEQTEMLYKALRHRDPAIRSAAFRALTDVQMQINKTLPAPIA
jgi:HEAT repeat protein